MKSITLDETSSLLAAATITQTIDLGQIIAHKGIAADGTSFVLVNGGTCGESIIIKL